LGVTDGRSIDTRYSQEIQQLNSLLAITLSGCAGVVVTLLGAITGGVIAGRSQQIHWRRDKQIDACTAITSESTRTQLALRTQWQHSKDRVDWNGWNQALAMISLVGTPKTIESADQMDAIFWASTAQMKTIGRNEEDWAAIVQRLESARLTFINIARQEIVGLRTTLDRLPIARPPMGKSTNQATAE
jgi:hypothetical protein